MKSNQSIHRDKNATDDKQMDFEPTLPPGPRQPGNGDYVSDHSGSSSAPGEGPNPTPPEYKSTTKKPQENKTSR